MKISTYNFLLSIFTFLLCMFAVLLTDLFWVTNEWYHYFGLIGYFLIGWAVNEWMRKYKK